LSSRRPDKLTELEPTVKQWAEKKDDRKARQRPAERGCFPDRRRSRITCAGRRIAGAGWWITPRWTDPEGRLTGVPHHPAL